MEEVLTYFFNCKSLSIVSLMICCCMSLARTTEDQNRLERIEECGTKCSQGLSCKTKSHILFPPQCRSAPEEMHTSPVFENISLSTVLRCEERHKCEMHLKIQTRMQIRESVRGMSVCTSSPGLIPNCRTLSFTEDSRKRLSGFLVNIENDCTKLSLNQEVQVTVQTDPPYCGTDWTQSYTAPGCTDEALQTRVPDCITGKLKYKVNLEEKSITVNVTQMREDYNYNLRLCQAKGYICASTGPLTVIKKEDAIKSATLSYSRLLPCLCIEGWSAVLDARRVQVCPFKQNMEELWTGIIFDPIEASLSWQPSCRVSALITLCQKQGHGNCIDLPFSAYNVTRQKVKFINVEPHPLLCLKFTVESESWIRCPFDDERFTAWKLTRDPEGTVLLFSPGTANFSVDLCEEESVVPSRTCQSTHNYALKVEKLTSVAVPLPALFHYRHFCLQVKRQDVRYSASFLHCFSPILQTYPTTSINPTLIIVPVGVMLVLVILIISILHIWFTVDQRRSQKIKGGSCPYEEQTDASPDCTLHSESTLFGEVFVPDSPQSRNNEKANLLSD